MAWNSVPSHPQASRDLVELRFYCCFLQSCISLKWEEEGRLEEEDRCCELSSSEYHMDLGVYSPSHISRL